MAAEDSGTVRSPHRGSDELDDVVRLILVDKGTEGFSTNTIKNKSSLRASVIR